MAFTRAALWSCFACTFLVSCGEAPLGTEVVRHPAKTDTGAYPCPADEGAMQQADGLLWLWNQPATSSTDWNGQCGNTAAANYILHACSWCLSPSDLDYEWDGLPGSRPSTVASLINGVAACSKVTLYEGSTDDELTPRRLCAHAGRSNPVALLVNQTGSKKKLHWINVLACDCRLQPDGSWSGQVTYVTWGSTPTSSCDELRTWLDAVPWPYPDANWVGK
jgi:hypothetical protein